MLNGITTRTSTPHEDAEPWPGGSARPVLDYLTGTLGMTGAAARELLKAARTAQAETGPGALADYPVPGGDAHLLIHYAPGSRAYRFKLSAPGENEVPPGTNPEPGAGPGNRPGPDGPPGGRETPDGSPPATPAARPHQSGRPRRGRRRSQSLSGTTSPSMTRGGIPSCWTATSPATPWSASSPTRPAPGGRRRRSSKRRSRSSTTTPGTPPGQSWPAPTTGAGCGRCHSPESSRVAAGRVAFAAESCGADRWGAGVRPATVRQAQGD